MTGANKTRADGKLLRRFEPIIQFTRGEQFFPIKVDKYVEGSSLWVQRPGEDPERLIDENELTLEKLSAPRTENFGDIHFLKFIEPLNITELATYRLREGLKRRDRRKEFHAGRGRLARVGYSSRFVDALFSLTLLARGRVPGDTAAAAAQTYRNMMKVDEEYAYYGRVIHEDNWIILQYWYFYPFNNWRSSFFGANDHEADWEMVCVYLYERDDRELVPEWVAYASHDFFGDDLRRRWDDPELIKDGEHPVIFAGAGSHASYFSSGEYISELELPFLSPLVRLVDFMQLRWRRWLKIAQGNRGMDVSQNMFNVFRIPFVDYARGDGISIGSDQDRMWAEPQMLDPVPGWVSKYRGLWGLYAQDPIAGENAPGGPMYNRDGSVRLAWLDPLGWAGLDKIPPPNKILRHTRQRIKFLGKHIRDLEESISENKNDLRNLTTESRAMQGRSHQLILHTAHNQKIESLSTQINMQKKELAQDIGLLESLIAYTKQLEQGYRDPVRAHIHDAQLPAITGELGISRFAEAWAAISIGLMLFGFVGIAIFAREFLIFGLAGVIAIIGIAEAGFRRQLPTLINSITNGLAIVASLVLLYEFFWGIVVAGVLIAGGYIIWENLRELWT